MTGPWLLDGDKLEALDKILDEEWPRLSKRNEDRLEKELDKKMEHYNDLNKLAGTRPESAEALSKIREETRASLMRYPYDYGEERLITIHLKEKKVTVKSFSEALREPNLLNETPVGFEMTVKNGDIKCEVEAGRGRKSLEISVSPEHVAEAREMFAALQRWANNSRAPKWQQLWVSGKGVMWFLWVFIVLLSISMASDDKTTAKDNYKEQAKQLLIGGVTPDNQTKAIEILLALQAEYVPARPARPFSYPAWFSILFFGGLIICILFSISPKIVLGIGKGQDLIHRWRAWSRFIFVLVPGFVLVNIIWPWIASKF